MSTDNQINNLFNVGITREQFIADYLEVKKNESADPSIFSDSFKESIGAVFDFLNTNKAEDGTEDTLDVNEISVFANLDTTDGNDVFSAKDVAILNDKLSKQKEVENPQDRFNREVRQDSKYYGKDLDNYLIQLEDETEIDKIDKQIEKERIKSQEKINKYEEQINDLVQKSNVLAQEEKDEYKAKKEELTQLRQKQIETENKIKEYKRRIEESKQNVKAFDEDVERYANDDNPEQTAARKTQLNSNIASLTQEYNELLKLNSGYANKIVNIQKSMQKIQSEAVLGNEKNNRKINNLKTKIDDERLNSEIKIRNFESQKELIKQQQEYAIQQIGLNDTPRGDFSDADTEAEWTTDAANLKAKWEKKGKHLSDGFYKKVVAIAGRLNCDPNALMGIMNAESGINPQAVNKNGGATGLIQFMPKTAKGYGTSTSELYNMSAEEQLVYVEKYLTRAKSSAGFGAGEKMSAGQVYALVFLPARARREVLTTSDEIYYKANSRTDINGDGAITKSELDQRARKFMA